MCRLATLRLTQPPLPPLPRFIRRELDSRLMRDDGTTAVTATVVGNRLVVAHVGDSRCAWLGWDGLDQEGTGRASERAAR